MRGKRQIETSKRESRGTFEGEEAETKETVKRGDGERVWERRQTHTIAQFLGAAAGCGIRLERSPAAAIDQGSSIFVGILDIGVTVSITTTIAVGCVASLGSTTASIRLLVRAVIPSTDTSDRRGRGRRACARRHRITRRLRVSGAAVRTHFCRFE